MTAGSAKSLALQSRNNLRQRSAQRGDGSEPEASAEGNFNCFSSHRAAFANNRYAIAP